MIIKNEAGMYTHTHSDTYAIRNVATGDICAGAFEPQPTEWEETDIKLSPDPKQMEDALNILGVQI